MKRALPVLIVLALSIFALAAYGGVAHIGNPTSTTSDRFPSISGDDLTIAYLEISSTGSVVRVYNGNSGVTTTISGTLTKCTRPRVSRDGGAVTFFAEGGPGSTTLYPYIYTFSGSTLTPVSTTSSTVCDSNKLNRNPPGISDYVSAIPAGYRVVFQDLYTPSGVPDGSYILNVLESAAGGATSIISDRVTSAEVPDLDSSAKHCVYEEGGQVILATTTTSGGGVPQSRSTVSVDTAGTLGNGVSTNPSINSSGTLVAFQSAADNLVSGDNNGKIDIFLRDLTGLTTREAYTDPAGEMDASAGDSINPQLCSHGTFVTFQTTSKTLISGLNYNNGGTVELGPFVMIASTSVTSPSLELLSFAAGSQTTARDGEFASVANGGFAVFDSNDSGISAGYAPPNYDIYEAYSHS